MCFIDEPPKEEQSDDVKKSDVLSPRGQKMMTSPMGDAGGTSEIRVYECQRRRIAGAMAMLSTMVKVTTVIPAKMAVAAGTAVASPLLPRDVKEDNLTPKYWLTPAIVTTGRDLSTNRPAYGLLVWRQDVRPGS